MKVKKEQTIKERDIQIRPKDYDPDQPYYLRKREKTYEMWTDMLGDFEYFEVFYKNKEKPAFGFNTHMIKQTSLS